MEWFVLDYHMRKNLLIIMMRGMVPIEFTSAYVISMNLQSFVSVSIKIDFYLKLVINLKLISEMFLTYLY